MRHVARYCRVLALAAVVRLLARVTRNRRRAVDTDSSRRVAVVGAYGNGNYGDDIIGESIVHAIRQFGGATTILGRGSDLELIRRFNPDSLTVGEGLSSVWRAYRIGRRGNFDVAILGGGGLLEGARDDINVHRLVLEYSAKLLAVGMSARRTAVYGIGVSPDLYSSSTVSGAVAAMLRSVDIVAVRDPGSFRIARQHSTDARLIRDPATDLFSEWSTRVEPGGPRASFVLLDRHRWPTFTPGPPEQEHLRETYIDSVVNAIVSEARSGTQIQLVAFHWSDHQLIRDVMKALPMSLASKVSAKTDVPIDSRDRFLDIMASGTVYTQRFHPALAALTSGARVEIVGELQKLEQLRASSTFIDGQWRLGAPYTAPKAALAEIVAW